MESGGLRQGSGERVVGFVSPRESPESRVKVGRLVTDVVSPGEVLSLLKSQFNLGGGWRRRDGNHGRADRLTNPFGGLSCQTIEIAAGALELLSPAHLSRSRLDELSVEDEPVSLHGHRRQEEVLGTVGIGELRDVPLEPLHIETGRRHLRVKAGDAREERRDRAGDGVGQVLGLRRTVDLAGKGEEAWETASNRPNAA